MRGSGDYILIVDDDHEIVALLTDWLGAGGYAISGVGNGADAIAQINNIPPELVLLDIHMPDMSGFELFRWMKTDVSTANIPVIFLSANVDFETRLEGLQLGAVDYIAKTCRREELLARVAIHLDLYRTRARLSERISELNSLNVQLRLAQASIRVLHGLIPICAACKNIRDDEGYWHAVEEYISRYSEATFSHGICPDCCAKLYPGLISA